MTATTLLTRRTRRIAATAAIIASFGWSTTALAHAPDSVATPPPTACQNLAQRIQFAPGTDHATVTGTFCVGQDSLYVLRAGAGRTMILDGDFSGQEVTVATADATPLPGGTGNSLRYQLPADGDYYIEIGTRRSDVTTYSFTVTIPPDQGAPQRLRFAPGTDRGTIAGSIADGVSDRYVLTGGAGQTMTLSNIGSLHVDVTAPDGSSLAAGPGDVITYNLPQSGDYIIDVNPGMGEQSRYSILVTIPPNSCTASNTHRVQFPRGTFGTSVHATVSGGSLQCYVLEAGAGRHMELQIQPSGAGALFSVLAPDGAVLAGGQTSAAVDLPSDGDYTVAVWSLGGTVEYQLWFRIA